MRVEMVSARRLAAIMISIDASSSSRASAPVLVVGSTGTVGGAVKRELEARGVPMRLFLRRLPRPPSLSRIDLDAPSPPPIEQFRGDLRNRGDVEAALEGVRSAFYVSPHEPEEEEMARSFTRACQRRGIRMVFVGSHIDGANRITRNLKRHLFGNLMPHYKAKFRLAERVRRSGAEAVLLTPSNFFQNDELVRKVLVEEGRLIEPIGVEAIDRVDVRDVAEVAAEALVGSSVAPGAYQVSGPRALSGPECAEIWSRASGRSIAYERDPESWCRLVRAQVAEPKASDVIKTYAKLEAHPVPVQAEAVAETTRIMGHAPRRYEDYVREMWAQWSGRRNSAAAS